MFRFVSFVFSAFVCLRIPCQESFCFFSYDFLSVLYYSSLRFFFGLLRVCVIRARYADMSVTGLCSLAIICFYFPVSQFVTTKVVSLYTITRMRKRDEHWVLF